jgi:ribosomal small subunit protein bTHX
MGKGDKRSRRGKIFAGSFGKTRPKHKKTNVPANAGEAKSDKKSK